MTSEGHVVDAAQSQDLDPGVLLQTLRVLSLPGLTASDGKGRQPGVGVAGQGYWDRRGTISAIPSLAQ